MSGEISKRPLARYCTLFRTLSFVRSYLGWQWRRLIRYHELIPRISGSDITSSINETCAHLDLSRTVDDLRLQHKAFPYLSSWGKAHTEWRGGRRLRKVRIFDICAQIKFGREAPPAQNGTMACGSLSQSNGTALDRKGEEWLSNLCS